MGQPQSRSWSTWKTAHPTRWRRACGFGTAGRIWWRDRVEHDVTLTGRISRLGDDDRAAKALELVKRLTLDATAKDVSDRRPAGHRVELQHDGALAFPG